MTDQTTRVLVSGGIEAPDPAIPGAYLVPDPRDAAEVKCPEGCGCGDAPVPGEALESQIDRLAKFIMAEIPGEPSRDEGAVDCAIRIMREAKSGGYLPAREFDGDDDTNLPSGTLAVLSPGDRVLLMLAADAQHAEAEAMRPALGNVFPGVHFMIVGGITGAMVLPGACVETPQED